MKWQVTRAERPAGSGPSLRGLVSIAAVALGLIAGPLTSGFAQDKSLPKDDALDSLLEKLTGPSDRGDKSSDKEGQDGKKAGDTAKPKDNGGAASEAKRPGAADAKGGKDQPGQSDGSSSLTGKDQEVDDLLRKLGETTETPAPDDRRRGGGAGEKSDQRGPGQRPDQKDQKRLTGKDKETDEHLEELTGRKKRKKDDDEERSGQAGQIIKEMRDIEQKLAKPDTGEGTREEQKKVVKQIETLIEEARKSGQSSIRRMVMRRRRQQGRERGQQPGQTEGAMAQGARATKPLTPTGKHARAGGKDIWGHLPPEDRAEIENMINELPLEARAELVERYFTSVNQRKVKREETP